MQQVLFHRALNIFNKSKPYIFFYKIEEYENTKVLF